MINYQLTAKHLNIKYTFGFINFKQKINLITM